MRKQELSTLNMAGFIKSQTLILLDKLNLDDCAELYEMAEALYLHLQRNLEG